MAINNSPTNAHGEVTTGQARTDHEQYDEQGEERSSANEKEQDPEITQAQGEATRQPGAAFEQGLNAVHEQEAEIRNEKFLKRVDALAAPKDGPWSHKRY